MNKNIIKPDNRNYLDNILVQKIKEGDNKVCTEMFNLYYNSLLRMIKSIIPNKEDAEDIAMETFEKAFEYIETYSNEYSFTTWLFSIGKNNAVDFTRKRKLNCVSLSDYIDNGSTDIEEEFFKREKTEFFRNIINRMENEKNRELIQKRYFADYSYNELADEFNVPLSTVKMWLYRSHRLLENQLVCYKKQRIKKQYKKTKKIK